MRIDVTGFVIPLDLYDHGVPRGRYWSADTYYLYCLAWDPHLLCRADAPPRLRRPGEAIERPGESLLLFSQPTQAADVPVVEEVLSRGGQVVLNHPSRELLDAVGPDFCAHGFGGTLISLRERWHLEASAHGPYIYPHTQEFLRLNPAAGRVFSRIGGNPDLVSAKNVAAFAGDPVAVIQRYDNMPDRLSKVMGDMGALLAHLAAHFAGRSVSPDEQRKMTRQRDLRRDFQSFGFAVLTIRELARCYGDDDVDLEEATRFAMDAARTFVEGSAREAAAGLRLAFESLERANRTHQPVPAVFTDTLHGGELYPDIGYFEIDWPEHPADVLRTYMDWSAKRSYRFNVDLGATTVRELALRFPGLFEELKVGQQRGRVEFVNGSCNQPYPPFHSLESQIRQFDTGREVWQDVFGGPPRTYASQEYGFCPQIGAVLKQQGYRNAVVRVQNMGDAPTVTDEQIEWEAPNGDTLRSLPSHPHKSEQENQFTYNNMHLKLWKHQQDRLDFAVFTCLGDITFHRPMREELARICHYAPVFGRFETLQRYFKQTRKVAAPRTRFAMREFNCDAGFINLDIWPVYKHYTGNYNTNCMNSLACSDLFAAAEMINAVAAIHGNEEMDQAVHDDHWEALTHYQGHGTYIVPYYQSGGFLGPGDSPRNREAGRISMNVHEYLGPGDFRPVVDVTTKWLESAKGTAEKSIRQSLTSANGEAACQAVSHIAVYNFAPSRSRLVRLPGQGGRHFRAGDAVVNSQDDGADRLALVDLPSYGLLVLCPTDASQGPPGDPVRTGPGVLENKTLRAEFDPATGQLIALVRKADDAILLREDSHAFYSPGSSTPCCTGTRIHASGPLRGAVEFDVELTRKGEVVCRLTTRASLDSGGEVLEFNTVVHEAPAVEDNQWENHLGVRFEVANPEFVVSACHFNVLEEVPHRTLSSTNVLVARSGAADVAFLNAGNQFYVREGGSLSNILIMENEPARRFRYAVGAAAANPLMQGRLWRESCHVIDTTADLAFSGSLFEFDSPAIELLSCRKEGDALLLRMANTTGERVRTAMRLWKPVATASRTLLNGEPKGELKVVDGEVKLNFRPWDIVQVRVRFCDG